MCHLWFPQLREKRDTPFARWLIEYYSGALTRPVQDIHEYSTVSSDGGVHSHALQVLVGTSARPRLACPEKIALYVASLPRPKQGTST